MRRIERKLSDVTKGRISSSLKNKPHTEEHKQNISRAMREYWRGIPYSVGEEGLYMEGNPEEKKN